MNNYTKPRCRHGNAPRLCAPCQEARAEKAEAERDALRTLAKQLAEALAIFPAAYPDRWEQMLHEEGCTGTVWAPNEREDECPCECDGDYSAELVNAALAAAKKAGLL